MPTNWVERLETRALLSAGDLDKTFGTAGQVVGQANLPESIFGPFVSAMAQQNDGRIILAGANYVTRVDERGNLDRTFGGQGVRLMPSTGDGGRTLAALRVDDHDRVILVDTREALSGHKTVLVARFTPNGELDRTFSGSGVATADFGKLNVTATDVAIARDGKIIVAGTSGGRFAVARFTTGGKLDRQFSVDGLQTIDLNSTDDVARAIAIQHDGSVLLAGYSVTSDHGADFAVVRLTSAGQRDSSFGAGGIATIDFGGNDYGTSINLRDDGTFAVAGFSGNVEEGGKLCVAKFTPSGALDRSFSGDGLLSPGAIRNAYASFQTDLITDAGGYRVVDKFGQFALTAAGTRNTRVGSGGVVDYSDEGVIDEYSPPFREALVRFDHSIVIAVAIELDRSGLAPHASFELRFCRADGTFVKAVRPDLPGDTSRHEVDSSGKLVVGGMTQSSYLFYRFNPSGKLDNSFADRGRSVVSPGDMRVYTPNIYPLGDGQIIFRGPGADPVDDDPIAILAFRLRANGTLDPDFGTGQIFIDETGNGNSALLPHGNLSTSYVDYFFEEAHGDVYLANGGSRGVTLSFSGSDPIYIGKIVASATSVAYTVEEPTFSEDGSVLSEKSHLVTSTGDSIDGDFRLLDLHPYNRVLYIRQGVRRLKANGTPDAGFGAGGVAGAGYDQFTVDAQNRIIAWKIRKDGDLQIARFTRNGKPDTTFGGDGQIKVRLAVKRQTNLLITKKDDLVITGLEVDENRARWSAKRILGD